MEEYPQTPRAVSCVPCPDSGRVIEIAQKWVNGNIQLQYQESSLAVLRHRADSEDTVNY